MMVRIKQDTAAKVLWQSSLHRLAMTVITANSKDNQFPA